jgi:hypothetical protein
MIEDLRVQILSDPEYDMLVADVFYQSKYMFMLYSDNLNGKRIVKAKFSSHEAVVSPFEGSIDLKTLTDIIAEAGSFYEGRLRSDANPMM